MDSIYDHHDPNHQKAFPFNQVFEFDEHLPDMFNQVQIFNDSISVSDVKKGSVIVGENLRKGSFLQSLHQPFSTFSPLFYIFVRKVSKDPVELEPGNTESLYHLNKVKT